MIVAFTGPSSPPRGNSLARRCVVQAMDQLAEECGDPTEIRTGAAFGIDSIAFFAALWRFESARHRVFVPRGCRYNEDVVLYAKQETHIEVVGVDGGYMRRNDALIGMPLYPEPRADILLAFPRTRTEELRSGTWATIRRARRAKTIVHITPLDEAYEAVVSSA